MNISSMTGFARNEGSFQAQNTNLSYTFEIKSVNAKGLDVKMRLPQGFEDIEFEIKNHIAQYFTRGTFNLLLEFDRSSHASDVKIDTALLEMLKKQTTDIYLSNPDVFEKPSPAALLMIDGVVIKEDNIFDQNTAAMLREDILTALDKTLEKLQLSRRKEGEKILAALIKILDAMDERRICVEKISMHAYESIKAKISEQINAFANSADITPERMEQEILFYIMRADVQEELDRLKAHVLTAREILSAGGAVGRKLDFLCQELNREANTLCSKSMDLEQTKIGMELKALIEQFREQIQNVE